jgi:PhnB protein
VAINPIPKGYRTLTPYLVVEGVSRLVDFLKETFGAQEVHPAMLRPDGSVMHAELRIGDSLVMMGEPTGEFKAMPAMLYVYVEDTDATYYRALQAGAKSVTEPADQFYGDRNAGITDPSGNCWWIATHKEDVSPEEAARRADEYFEKELTA